jgi:hypothetical protein
VLAYAGPVSPARRGAARRGSARRTVMHGHSKCCQVMTHFFPMTALSIPRLLWGERCST